MKKILLAASLVISITGLSQNISNKLSFKKGQKLEVVTETKKTSIMELMGQPMETVVSSTMTESYDIENADANGATIEYKVKHLVLEASGMQGKQSFDSEKEGDRKGDLGKLLEKRLKNKYTMTVDAYGKVTTVKVDDDNPNAGKNSDEEAMMEMVSSQLGLGFGLPKEGDASIFKLLPANEIALGSSWIDSASNNGQKKKATYTVSRISDTDVILDYTEDIDINTTQQIMGNEAKIKTASKTTGQIMLDRTTGLLKQKSYTTDSNGTIEGQGMSLPLTDKVSITITVKAL